MRFKLIFLDATDTAPTGLSEDIVVAETGIVAGARVAGVAGSIKAA